LAEGLAYQCETSRFRQGRPRGEPSAELPPTAFVGFLQNHDHVGNHPFGTRLAARASEQALHAGAAVLLLSPTIPLLFMGEEWASRRPFAFFCDFAPQLAQSVRDGRRREFAQFPDFRDEAARERIPDPTAAATFAASQLDWAEVEAPEHACWLARYRALIEIRRREIVPRLAGMPGFAGRYRVLAAKAVEVEWRLGDGSQLILLANFSEEAVSGSPQCQNGDLVYSSASPGAPASASFFLRPPATG
jgi:1,4-alpha-glucan branching enzyme